MEYLRIATKGVVLHGMHARLPKNFVLEERLDRYADAIELLPSSYAGRWAEACAPLSSERCEPFREVRLDLGCGKGAYLVTCAKREPDVLFLGVDSEPLCIAYAAQAVCEAGLENAIVTPGRGDQIPSFFATGELSLITINFPTPFPRKKDATRRLVILERLLDYRKVLAQGGAVRLKTDSLPLRDFALTQFKLAGYEVLWSTDDARAKLPNEPTSEYEERLTAQGACVYAIAAKPGADPGRVEQTAPLSLVDYLPQDLEALDYVPHGMQGTVTNLRNRALRRKRIQ